MAGYPGNPLPKKLGIKAGQKVCLLNAPGTFERSLRGDTKADDLHVTHDLRFPMIDVVVMFVDSLEELERRFTDIVGRLHPAGGFWVAWRRNSRRISGDLVCRIALAAGMSANKACTIGHSYDGIRLVLRTEMREAMAYRMEPPEVTRIGRRTRRPTARIAPRIARASSGAGSTLRRARARSTR
jgi:hypothetical protein